MEIFRGFPQSLKNDNTVSRVLTYPSFMFTVASNSLLNSSWNLKAIAKKAHSKHHSKAKPKNVLIICVQYLVILWITSDSCKEGGMEVFASSKLITVWTAHTRNTGRRRTQIDLGKRTWFPGQFNFVSYVGKWLWCSIYYFWGYST